MPTGKKMDFTAATARARHIRELYKQLEERLHGLGVDISKAFTTKMNELDVQLTKSVARSKKTA